jgi:hypothetical protein
LPVQDTKELQQAVHPEWVDFLTPLIREFLDVILAAISIMQLRLVGSIHAVGRCPFFSSTVVAVYVPSNTPV